MALITANPKRNHRRSHSIFDHLFNELVHAAKPGNPVSKNSDVYRNRPAVNIIEGKDDFKINMAIPGYSKDEVSINIEKDRLKVEAKKEAETKESEKFIRREFKMNGYERSFELPKTIDKTKVSANFNNGILTITLAKKEEAKELPARTIEIQD